MESRFRCIGACCHLAAIVMVLVCAAGLVPRNASGATAEDSAANKAKAEKKLAADHERMLGTWRIESFEIDGVKMSKDALKLMTATIKKDAFTLVNRGKDSLQLQYKVKANKKAKAKVKGTGVFDTTHELEPGKPIRQLGIYAFKAERLRICIAPAGKPRPTDFKAAKGCSVFQLIKQPKEESSK